jgi:predicted kinase
LQRLFIIIIIYEEVFLVKKLVTALSILIALFSYCATSLAVPSYPTSSTVLVNGKIIAFDAYNINDNNYFKLRDLAYVLNGTNKQFAVIWNGNENTITSGQNYTSIGGEMVVAGNNSAVTNAVITNAKVLLNGKQIQVAAYNIDGYNYFRLRDIGEAFDFGIYWDGQLNTITVDTNQKYLADVNTGQWEAANNSSNENLLAAMTTTERESLNAFLSSFSEWNFDSYDSANYSAIEVSRWGFWHIWSNSPSQLDQVPGGYALSLDTVDEMVYKHLGIRLASDLEKFGQQTVNIDDDVSFANGTFLYAGEALEKGFPWYRWANVEELFDNGDSTFTAIFTIYSEGGSLLTDQYKD